MNDVRNGFHLHTFCLVDILERIEGLVLLVLNNADLIAKAALRRRIPKKGGKAEWNPYLPKGTFTDAAQEEEVKEIDFTVIVDRLRDNNGYDKDDENEWR
mgnify:CR=1 FL=1